MYSEGGYIMLTQNFANSWSHSGCHLASITMFINFAVQNCFENSWTLLKRCAEKCVRIDVNFVPFGKLDIEQITPRKFLTGLFYLIERYGACFSSHNNMPCFAYGFSHPGHEIFWISNESAFRLQLRARKDMELLETEPK